MTTPEIPPAGRPASLPDLGSRLGGLANVVEDLVLAVDKERAVRERESVNTVRRVEADDRAHKRSVAAIVCAVAVMAGGLLWAFVQNGEDSAQQDQLEVIVTQQVQASNQQEIDQCLSTNDRVLSLRDAFKSFTDAMVAVPPATPRTPDEQAAFDARVAAFRADLTRRLAPLSVRDCSPEALGLIPPEERNP